MRDSSQLVIAYLGYKSFVTNLSNFLDVLLVIFIPWSAVNLADYFLVRGGNYDVASFFVADGVYGRFAWRGLLAYAMGLAWAFVYQLTTPARWSRHSAAPTSPGWSAGSPQPSSTCCLSPSHRPPATPAGCHHRQIAVMLMPSLVPPSGSDQPDRSIRHVSTHGGIL